MLEREQLLTALMGDPLALYPALAAVLLASVALASGLMRGDVLALARPVPVAWLLASLAGSYAVASAAAAVAAPLHAEVLTGVARLPLYLFALAYGPLPAMVAAALAAAYLPLPLDMPWASYLLALELVVIGWLAVWPTPRRHVGVAGIYALLGYGLTAGTAGITVMALGGAVVDLDALRAHHGAVPLGVAVAALVLAAVPPRLFDGLFRGSRIAGSVDPPTASTMTSTELVPAGDRQRADLAAAVAPPPLVRARRRRDRPADVILRAEPLRRRRR